jgi:hypothetical protein
MEMQAVLGDLIEIVATGSTNLGVSLLRHEPFESLKGAFHEPEQLGFVDGASGTEVRDQRPEREVRGEPGADVVGGVVVRIDGHLCSPMFCRQRRRRFRQRQWSGRMIAPAGSGEPGKIIIERCANGWVVWIGGVTTPSWQSQCHVARSPDELVSVVAAIAGGSSAPSSEPDNIDMALRDLRAGVDRLVLIATRDAARA